MNCLWCGRLTEKEVPYCSDYCRDMDANRRKSTKDGKPTYGNLGSYGTEEEKK